jgi:23S rRNA pseudouridine1911/1915/1917 synthase
MQAGMAAIIYADERIVVINKPPGISLATRHADPHGAADRLIAAIPRAAAESASLESGSLWLVHRLDVTTTGAVLLARDEATHRILAQLLSKRLIRKTYLALVWGHPHPHAGVYDSPLAPDLRDRRRMKIDPKGRPSITRYRTMVKAPHVSLLELHPETGRTHQIRVHLASAGHWIVGDDLYGGTRHAGVKDPGLRKVLNPPHLLLHAWRIEIPESANIFPCFFQAPLPPCFQDALEGLRMNVNFQLLSGSAS